MKRGIRVIFLMLGLISIQKGCAQDLLSLNKQYCKLLRDTAGVKMILVTLPPLAKLQTHTHPTHMGFIIQGGMYKWTFVNGESGRAVMKPGDHFMRGPEGPHYSWNGGNSTLQFILVELEEPKAK